MRHKFVAFFGLLMVLTLLSAAAGMASARVLVENQQSTGSNRVFLPVILTDGISPVTFSKKIIHLPETRHNVSTADMDGDGDVDVLGAQEYGDLVSKSYEIAWWEQLP